MIILAPLFILIMITTANAGEVIQVKSNKVLLSISPGEFKVGDEAYTTGPDGKRKGLVKITTVRGDKAIGELEKGAADKGFKLQIKLNANPTPPPPPPKATANNLDDALGVPAAATDAGRSERPPFGFMKVGKSGMGALVGLSQNTLKLQAVAGATSESLALAGSSFNLLGFVEMNNSRKMTTRLAFGVEQFEVSGSATNAIFCSNTNTCGVGFTYLAAEGSLQYSIFSSGSDKSRLWMGVGGEFLFAVSKKNNVSALNTADSTNYFMFLSAGYDLGMDPKSFIPLVVDYGFQMSASNASAGVLVFRTGYAWRY